jgi:hypothetical protein
MDLIIGKFLKNPAVKIKHKNMKVDMHSDMDVMQVMAV